MGTNNIDGENLFSSKVREKEELALLKPCLSNGGTFIDIILVALGRESQDTTMVLRKLLL